MMLYPIEYKEGVIWVDKSIKVKNIKVDELCFEVGESIHPDEEIKSFHKTLSSNEVWKIVGQSPNLSLPNVPYVEIEKSVNELANQYKYFLTGSDKEISHIAAQVCGFIEGYKAASTKKYTEEDLRNLLKYIGSKDLYVETDGSVWKDESDGCEKVDAVNEFVKSIQPKIKSIEIEMTEGTEDFTGAPVVGEERPMTYQKHGKTYLKVEKLNYEN